SPAWPRYRPGPGRRRSPSQSGGCRPRGGRPRRTATSAPFCAAWRPSLRSPWRRASLRPAQAPRAAWPPYALLSDGAPPAAPPGGIGQREQVQAADRKQGEREQRQEIHPIGGLLPGALGNEDGGDDRGKDDRQPAVDLPNPLVPVQWGLL